LNDNDRNDLNWRDEETGDPHQRDRRSPWLELWVHPRQVTRWFLHSTEPLKNALPLALLAAIFSAFNTASSRNWGDDSSVIGMIFRILITGLISGLAGYYIGAPLLRWVGSWFGGEGTTNDMKVVIGQIASRASILLGLLLIPELLIAGKELFTSATPQLAAEPIRAAALSFLLILEGALGIWLFIVSLQSIGEAHGFSAWKALAVELILIVAAFVVIFIFAMIVLAAFSTPF